MKAVDEITITDYTISQEELDKVTEFYMSKGYKVSTNYGDRRFWKVIDINLEDLDGELKERRES